MRTRTKTNIDKSTRTLSDEGLERALSTETSKRSVWLTKSRKMSIEKFKSKSDLGNNKKVWIKQLYIAIHSEDPKVKFSDVKRWCKNHPWITNFDTQCQVNLQSIIGNDETSTGTNSLMTEQERPIVEIPKKSKNTSTLIIMRRPKPIQNIVNKFHALISECKVESDAVNPSFVQDLKNVYQKHFPVAQESPLCSNCAVVMNKPVVKLDNYA